MGQNLRNIQFLRSESVYSGLTAAKEALSLQINNLKDGSPIIGRYLYGSGETKEVKSVIGIAHVGASGQTGVTFFESANDIADAIAKLQAEMDATQGAVGTNADGTKATNTGKYISSATTVEGEIKALNDALEALDYGGYTLGESEVFATITEDDGLITATGKNLSGIKLAGYAVGGDNSGKVDATDTLGEALGKLQGQINGMDKAADVVDGQVVTTVTEADGKVTETKANVKDLQLGGYAKTSDTGNIGATDTVNVALSKLENKAAAITIGNDDGSINVSTAASGTNINVNIKSGEHVLAKDGNAGLYTNIALSSITPSSTTVKEEYQLTATDGTKLGDTIKIYKDSSLVSIKYITDSGDTHYQNLEYVYVDNSGNTKTEYVDMSTLLIESEFASGVTVTAAGVVTGVVDGASEKVIVAYHTSGNTEADVFTVGEDGFKVANIQNAINAAVGKATTTVELEDNTTAGTSVGVAEHVTLSSETASNGQVTYTIHTNDIASKNDLDNEVTRAKSAEAAFDSVLGSTKAVGSETRTWTKSGVHYVGTGVTVKDDIVTLDSKVFELSGKTVTDFTSANNSITITSDTADDGTVTVDLVTDASKISGLTEVDDITTGAAKVSGVTETDSVQTGIENLYASLKSEIAARKAAIAARTITSANNGIAVAETAKEDGFGTTLTLTLDGTTNGTGEEKEGTDNALTITNNGLFLSTDWNCGTF